MEVSRQELSVDIACVGFGPAMGGFLTTLSRQLLNEDGTPKVESKVSPGLPLQVLCYERADDTSFGVSGIVTKAKSIKKTFPDFDHSAIPMCCPVGKEKVIYLLDPIGASRRSPLLRFVDSSLRALKFLPWAKDNAFELPWIPPFLNKHGGLLLSMGQFTQWVSSNLMSTGLVQIWPGMPVKEPLIEDKQVKGIRLVDQGVNKTGQPEDGMFMPGMDIKSLLTVVGDGPVGAVGRALNDAFGMPEGHHQRDWAVGMKFVIELPEECELEAGTVLHTLGYPEPEIFGFMYVYPERICSLGVFVPSWFDSPVRTTYRYLQHWMLHPYIYKHLKGGTVRSWGAKSIQESGKRGEPFLCGDGYARIGEGSGSTNVLTNSGVDEAWETGVQLAEAVLELASTGKDFSKENLEATYVARRRESRLERESKISEKARDGFQLGFIPGIIGTGLAGLTNGIVHIPAKIRKTSERIPSLKEYYRGKISSKELEDAKHDAFVSKKPLHDVLMEKAGWPQIPYDGKLFLSHQDALLLGGKVQAPAGFSDHVQFLYPSLCASCESKICIEVCSAQAISRGDDNGVPEFDREKCVHCGACVWNCSKENPKDEEAGLVKFGAGAGGLHSVEN